jgi:hypothetical protein
MTDSEFLGTLIVMLAGALIGFIVGSSISDDCEEYPEDLDD